jgi:hypothetical protein
LLPAALKQVIVFWTGDPKDKDMRAKKADKRVVFSILLSVNVKSERMNLE